MQDHLNKHVWLIGAGQMAISYSAVLEAMGADLTVIGRGKKSSDAFAAETGKKPEVGGLDAFLARENEPAKFAIVATDILSLDSAAIQLVKAGVKNILIEKPGSLSCKSLMELQAAAKAQGCKVSIAYNRRFYSSVRALSEMVEVDGGVSSCFFEFSEWADVISQLDVADEVKQRWFLANSTHVVDLVFSFIGAPKKITAQHSACLSWHRSAGIFVGGGISEREVPFSWHSNWTGPGRWGIEFVTRKNRYYLRPMEVLHKTERGNVDVRPVKIDETLDLEYKPGLYQQVNSFLSGGCNMTCDLDQHLKHWDFYLEIAGYTDH